MIVSPVARGHNGPMAKRRIYDDELHAQFVTFSCYRRRRSLAHPRARQIVMGVLAAELKKHDGTCCGFVVMPDHVTEVLSVQLVHGKEGPGETRLHAQEPGHRGPGRTSMRLAMEFGPVL